MSYGAWSQMSSMGVELDSSEALRGHGGFGKVGENMYLIKRYFTHTHYPVFRNIASTGSYKLLIYLFHIILFSRTAKRLSLPFDNTIIIRSSIVIVFPKAFLRCLENCSFDSITENGSALEAILTIYQRVFSRL